MTILYYIVTTTIVIAKVYEYYNNIEYITYPTLPYTYIIIPPLPCPYQLLQQQPATKYYKIYYYMWYCYYYYSMKRVTFECERKKESHENECTEKQANTATNNSSPLIYILYYILYYMLCSVVIHYESHHSYSITIANTRLQQPQYSNYKINHYLISLVYFISKV